MSELFRRLSNLARFGTVTETKSANGKALARVKIGERVSDFLPVKSFSNSFKKHWIPIRPEEQVLVISPFGDANSGLVLRSIFNKNAKEPVGANDHTEIIEYEDGTKISYDTQAKELTINAAGTVNIICKNANITASQGVTITGPLHVTQDISTDGGVTDSRGDLTNFSTTDGANRA